MLSKGIAMCERSRLTDLKGTMSHLLARVQYRTSPRAALKMIDNLLPDLETYQQTVWVYAFRFLRTSLSLQLPTSSEIPNALHNLRSITSLAEKHRHVPVVIMSSILEAMIHLRTASAESVELAQRAIATARSHQLNPSLQQTPQLIALVDILDLIAELMAHNTEAAGLKIQAMQSTLDKAKDLPWNTDGAFRVSTVIQAPIELDEDANGVMQRDAHGNYALVFDWLTRSELYMLGYVLSGIGAFQRNALDRKGSQYLEAAVKLTNGESSA